MGNPWAGEVALVMNGERHVLKLTLGALAQLEAALGDDDLISLIERFEKGRFSARDLSALLLAGLTGGGWIGSADDLAHADIKGGPIEAARAAGLLLQRGFGGDGGV